MAHDLTSDFTVEAPEERQFITFDDGDYSFTIGEIYSFEVSKKGNDMLPLDLLFTRKSDNETVKVREYLVFTEGAKYKINQFLASIKVKIGTRINFRDDEFLKYLKARTGVATLTTETFVKKDGGEGRKNVVAGYVYDGTSKRESAAAAKPPAFVPPVEEEDNIPF